MPEKNVHIFIGKMYSNERVNSTEGILIPAESGNQWKMQFNSLI